MSIEPNLIGLTSVNLFQVTDPIRVHHKQTSEQVLAQWEFLMEPINAIININGTAGNPAANQITETQRANFETALTDLISIARDGFSFDITVGDPPVTKTVRDVITVEMAQDLDNLLRTIESAHPGAQFNTGVATIPIAAARAWRDFAEASPVINQIVQHMNSARAVGGVWNENGTYLDGVVNERGILQVGSLQSMIELLFVKTGNELLADNLEQLEAALQVNQKALQSLTSIQGLHNNIAAYSKGDLTKELGVITPGGSIPDPLTPIPEDRTRADEYTSQAGEISAFFDSIKPKLGPGLESAYDIISSYLTAVDKIKDLSIVTKFNTLNSQINTTMSELTTSQVGWTEAERTLFVRAVIEYRTVATEYNNLIKQLTASLQPFRELLGIAPNAPFVINLPLPLGLTTIEINDNVLLPMPTFTSDQIPFPIIPIPPNQFGSTSAQLIAFRDGLLAQTQAIFAQPFNTNIVNGVPAPSNADVIATGLYSFPAISSGNNPIASFDLANKIQQQYVILNEQIDALSLDANQVADPNSLLSRLKVVVADMENAGINDIPAVAGFGGLSDANKKAMVQAITAFANEWVLDGLAADNAAASGKIQENLGFAITAAQSLNDQQKEETRRFLFLFEEFYKSASAILTKITQILEKMAQNINR